MDYRKYVSLSHIDFKVNDHLIECGHTTWQIRNIAATSIGRTVIPFTEPEPKFDRPEPSFDLNVGGLAVAAGLVWLGVRYVLGMPNGALVAAIGVAALFVHGAVDTLNTSKAAWAAERDKTQRQRAIWEQMRNNPPVLYSLMLETNAGTKPLFYSMDEAQIKQVNAAIKRSMEKKETGDIHLEIESVNVGGPDAINNFGSSIYNQSVQNA